MERERERGRERETLTFYFLNQIRNTFQSVQRVFCSRERKSLVLPEIVLLSTNLGVLKMFYIWNNIRVPIKEERTTSTEF